jgi:hypothetical protein
MKALRIILLIFGFVFQIILPIVIFGMVVPYFHGNLDSGLTGAGIIALAILVIIITNKLKEKLKEQPKSALRGILLSIFPIAIWSVLGIGVEKVAQFFLTLTDYWWLALIFIIIGRIFYIVEEALTDKLEKKQGDK